MERSESRPLVCLLVDDHPVVLVDLPPLLERAGGLRVLGASSIEMALKVLRNNAVDVVVADWKLGRAGDADGGDLLDACARWHPSVARILASVDPGGATVAESLGHAWYDKDEPASVLVALIRRVAKR